MTNSVTDFIVLLSASEHGVDAIEKATAERAVIGAVAAMRAAKYSWASIGGVLGTTGQAAHHLYGPREK